MGRRLPAQNRNEVVEPSKIDSSMRTVVFPRVFLVWRPLLLTYTVAFAYFYAIYADMPS